MVMQTAPLAQGGRGPAPTVVGEVAGLRDVRKRYGKITALEDVSLSLRSGEVLALLGPNGAGKTTAVSLLLGLIRADSGEVTLFGGSPQAAANRMRSGVMLQLSGVPETLTVAEHVGLFAAYYPQPLALADVLAQTGLTGLERRLYGKLSGGQKQRLHLALALVGNPDLLFLDEPTTGLDVGSRRALWDGVRQFVAQGKTVLLTTHYLEEADALADRIVVLNRGSVIAEGTPSAIKERVAGRRVRFQTTLSLAEVRALPSVEAQNVQQDGAAFEVHVSRAEPVVRDLLERDPDLSGLEVIGVGLEEAFLSLTEGSGNLT
jgi:ABC-2 type transport system ATP-binding protein